MIIKSKEEKITAALVDDSERRIFLGNTIGEVKVAFKFSKLNSLDLQF
jgi:hypothetical protein